MKYFLSFIDLQGHPLHRDKREAHTIKNRTDKDEAHTIKNKTEIQSTDDTVLKLNKLLLEGRLQLCQSNDDRCSSGPPGPPGPPGPIGKRGARGRRGQKGKTGDKGDHGIVGLPGRHGKQGIIGPVGMKGEPGTNGIKGEKGDMGAAGMPGSKGEPGESISIPTVVVSPTTLTVNETQSASFQCSATGNPEPTVMWIKLGNQSEIAQSAVSGGTLQLENVTGNDAGVYKCLGINILGRNHASVQLVVNGKDV